MICFSVEIIGLLWLAWRLCRGWRKSASYWRGQVFAGVPGIGCSGGKSGSAANQGAALATYTVFMDLSLGVTDHWLGW